MAGDTFSVDAKAFAAAADAMKNLRSSAAGAKADMGGIVSAMNAYSQLSQQISAAKIVNPSEKRQLIELGRELKKLGVTKKALADSAGKELTAYKNLSALDKMRVRMLQAQSVWQDKITKNVIIGNRVMQLENRSLKEQVGSLGGMASKWKDVAGSAVNLDLSLTGIVRLMFEIQNQQRRVGAMAMQTAAQWGEIPEHTEAASTLISQLAGKFRMTTDAAGELVKAIAQAGVKGEDANKVIEEMKAIELTTGVAVQESVGFVNNLVKAYSLTNLEASKLERTVIESAKQIPGLGPSEALSDFKELADMGRAYNVSLLDTLSLYNMLGRKEMAKTLGLGDAPQQIRKEVSKTIVGFNQNLEDGWKAALGQGATAASKILNFEKLAPDAQFIRMAQKIREVTSGRIGDEREYAVRLLLKQFGFTAVEVNKTLASAFASGGFDDKALQDVVSTMGQERRRLEEQVGGDLQYKGKMLDYAQRIAGLLQPWSDRTTLAIRDALLKDPKWKDLSGMLDKIQKDAISAIPDIAAALTTIAGILGSIYDLLKKAITFWKNPIESLGKDLDTALGWGAEGRKSLLDEAHKSGGRIQKRIDATYKDHPEALINASRMLDISEPTLNKSLQAFGLSDITGMPTATKKQALIDKIQEEISDMRGPVGNLGVVNEMSKYVEALVDEKQNLFMEIIRYELSKKRIMLEQATPLAGTTSSVAGTVQQTENKVQR